MQPIRSLLLVFCLILAGGSSAFPAGAQPHPGSAPERSRLPAEPLYTVQDLGTLDAGSTYGRAVNSAGQVTGWSTNGSGLIYERAFLWQAGTMQALPVPGGVPDSSIGYSINTAGQVAGYSSTSTSASHAVLWSGGGASDLGTLGGRNSAALHINDNGQMVGWSEFDPDSGERRAAIWSGGLSALAQGGNYDAAWSINDLGKAVGECTTLGTSMLTQPCAWPGGVLAVLGGSQGSARDINDAGTIAGWTETTAIDHKGGHIPHAVIWDSTGIHDLGTLPGGTLTSRANAINAGGQVVGAGTLISDLATGVTHAVLWEDDQVIDLNDCIPTDSGWVLSEAYGINDAGQIVGTGGHDGVYYRAFLLTPVTQPQVSLTGPGAGLAGQTYTFTATSGPASLETPVKYDWSATDQTDFTESTGLTSTHDLNWAQTGSKRVMVAVTSALGAAGKASLAVDIGDVLVQPPNGSGAQIGYTFAPGRTVGITIPAGAVPGGTQLLFTALPQPDTSPVYKFAGMAFKLDAYTGGQRQVGFVFDQPVTVTLHFTAADVAGLEESDIRLYYQQDSAWIDAALTCRPANPYVRDLVQHTLSVQVCHLSTFATWTVDEAYLLLPLITK
jgi:probable HAF family extracellular repeat protein